MMGKVTATDQEDPRQQAKTPSPVGAPVHSPGAGAPHGGCPSEESV